MGYFDNYNLEACTRVDAHGYKWIREGLSYTNDFTRTLWKLRNTYPSALEYLQRHQEDFPWSTLVLRHGRVFVPESRSTMKLRFKNGDYIGEGHCFRESLDHSIAWHQDRELNPNQKIRYVEGLCVSPLGPFAHAWISIDGELYDPTWMMGYMCTYFGIEINPVVACNLCYQIGHYGLIHKDNWEKAHPLLEALFKK